MAAMAGMSLQLTRGNLRGESGQDTVFHKLRPSNAQWAAKGSFHLKSKVGKVGGGGLAKAQASSTTDLAGAADWGEPISLGTVKLPPNVNLQKLEGYLYQWGSSLTQNANLPLPVPLKVDKIEGGVRLGYIRLVNGAIEDLAHIDCVVYPGTKESGAMFRAVRSGQLKKEVPPGEPVIMQSLLQALKKSIELSRG